VTNENENYYHSFYENEDFWSWRKMKKKIKQAEFKKNNENKIYLKQWQWLYQILIKRLVI